MYVEATNYILTNRSQYLNRGQKLVPNIYIIKWVDNYYILTSRPQTENKRHNTVPKLISYFQYDTFIFLLYAVK